MGGRVALVGIDGFCPVTLDRMLAAGSLPAWAAIADRGSRARLDSSVPATTPVAWTTIATGCLPATHGIHGFLLQQEGRDLDDRVAGVYAQRCRAETLWETATLNGLRAIVLRFPVSYPSNMVSLRVDGAAGWGGLRCIHEVSPAGVRRIEDSGRPWKGRPTGAVSLYGTVSLPSLWERSPTVLHVAVACIDGAETTFLAAEADWDRVVAAATTGGWSGPATVEAEGAHSTQLVAFRFKPLSEGRLLTTPAHAVAGHSYPEPAWCSLLDAVGPIEEQCEPDLFLAGEIDLDTQMELFRLTTDWTKATVAHLLRKESWDLFMVHVHHVDWAHHMLQGAVDPRHPLFDPELAKRCRAALEEAYRMADEVVEAVAGSLSEDDNIIVVGDHGQDLHHTTFRPNEWLAKQGLLRWGEAGTIDWSATQLCCLGNFLYVNQKGRQPSGIVPEGETAALLEKVGDDLCAVVDPATGQRPIAEAFRKAALACMGGDGGAVGDMTLFCTPGYQLRNDPGPVFAVTRPLGEFTSGHDHFWPKHPRIGTQLFASGPAFRCGAEARRPHGLEDVAPTVCAALGIEPSLQCEGVPIDHILNPRGPQ